MSPAGLDGNPDPIVTPSRSLVIAAVADAVVALPSGRRLVAIDGIDGAGKSTFADEVAAAITTRSDREVVRSTIDSFHLPRARRWARGIDSPEGFYLDSHDLATAAEVLLDPFAAGAAVRLAAFDEPSDAAVDAPLVDPTPDAILLFDGIFVLRPELRLRWDLSVHVDGRARVRDRRLRLVARDRPPDPCAAFLHDLAWWSRLRRYHDGQRIYLDRCDPLAAADLVVRNDDLGNPSLEARSHGGGSASRDAAPLDSR